MANIADGTSYKWLPSRSKGHDLRSQDGRTIVELKERISDRRAFIAAVTQLALDCKQARGVETAYLALLAPRLARATTRSLWSELLELFDPGVAKRLRLVCVWPNSDLLIPDNDKGRQFALAVRTAAESSKGPTPKADKSYEVLKLLILRKLRQDGPLKIKKLQAETGLSHPTVKRDLDRLRRFIDRASDRSVRLKSFPVEEWHQLRALAQKVRKSAYYADASGGPVDLPRLARRIRELELGHVAIGGVIAAKVWQPDFDLDGTPRIDLCVHAPDGRLDLSFLPSIDAALERTDDPSRAVVVVHSLLRRTSHFTMHPELGYVADPVETLLDLYELRLDSQAEDFLDAFLKRHK